MNRWVAAVQVTRVDWFTPRWLLDLLGEFDLDPCAGNPRPWDIARTNYTREDDGLVKQWEGRVFVNPPYGRGIWDWVVKFNQHGNGIMLTGAYSTESEWGQLLIGRADAVNFIKRRIKFCDSSGVPSKQTFGSTMLTAIGEKNVEAIWRVAGIVMVPGG